MGRIKKLVLVLVFFDWLANKNPPWESYREFISGRLIAINKQPGVWLIRLFAKCVLTVTGPEATNVCQDDQLCAGWKSGIDGAVHGAQAILDAN